MDPPETWVTVALAIIAALGGGAAARLYKGYRAVKTDAEADKRSDDDERREKRAEDIAEKISDKIVADLTAQIERLNKELSGVREAKAGIEKEIAIERTEKYKLMRRLSLLGRRSDITDIGILLDGSDES